MVQDVEEIDETAFEIVGGKSQIREWPGHGLRLKVPANAVPAGTTARITIKALLDGEFEPPENSTLITAIYQITVSQPFKSFVTLFLQHCAVIESEAQSSEFQFVETKCTQSDPPYQLKVIKGGVFTKHSQEAYIQVKRFSRFAAICTTNSKLLYYQQVFYRQFQGNYPWQLDFIVTRYIKSHIGVSVHVCIHPGACSNDIKCIHVYNATLS